MKAYERLCAALGPALYWPLDDAAGSSTVRDASGNGRAGTVAGGVTLRQELNLSGGGYGADFDGTDDAITSTYGTRRNGAPNPKAANDTATWVVNTAGDTITRSTDDPDALLGTATYLAVTHDGVEADEGIAMSSLSGPAAASGQTWTASIYARGQIPGGSTVDDPLKLRIIERDAAGAFLANTDFSFTAGAAWQRVSVTRTLTNAATAFVTMSVLRQTVVTGTFYLKGAMIERASAVGDYFDGSGYIDGSGAWVADPGGKVGWLGTAHNSASDKGCFANGTARTFAGWAWRDDAAATHTLVSANASGTDRMGIQLFGANTVIFDAQISAGDSDSWASWPGNAQWVHWAIVFNEAADQVSLYINGALVSTLTHTDQYSAAIGNFIVGRLGSTNASPLNGKMAHVAVWERGLTADEIATLYKTGATGLGTGRGGRRR